MIGMSHSYYIRDRDNRSDEDVSHDDEHDFPGSDGFLKLFAWDSFVWVFEGFEGFFGCF